MLSASEIKIVLETALLANLDPVSIATLRKMFDEDPSADTIRHLLEEIREEWKGKGFTVERRPLRQWMLRITTYAQRLIDELDGLDWPEGIKLLQKNWIGRSSRNGKAEGISTASSARSQDQWCSLRGPSRRQSPAI